MADNQQKTCKKAGEFSPAFIYIYRIYFVLTEDKMSGDKNTLTEGNKIRLKNNIIQGAQNFNQYLNNKTFCIVCEDGEETLIRFFQNDYKHLTGITSDLNDNEFYKKCFDGTISTGNIEDEQHYNWNTLKKKTDRIAKIHVLLYTNAEKTLLINQLKVNTTVFPTAIKNNAENICVGFVSKANKARSLRTASSSTDTKSEKNIVGIFSKANSESDFSELVYIKEDNTAISVYEKIKNLSSDLKKEIAKKKKSE